MNTHPSSESLQPPIVRHSRRPEFRLSRMFWTGFILLILGTGPLDIVIMLARHWVTQDPDPNPIAFGSVGFLTFWLGVILMIVGVRASYLRYRSAAQKEGRPPDVLQPLLVQQPQRPKFRLPRVFWAGLILLVLGTGPLLTVILLARFGVTKDPDPNPIGVGILAFLTFWPSVVLVIVGLVIALSRLPGQRAVEAKNHH
jgi:hypothetical protein